ncbi:DUF1003 domain-containing protein [Kocuria palustris]|jgi:uncharacterized membrane protein|uniref:DUF1003 domain-containing protein n=1 Tax=Kocuria palustris TaxID=71999 RepID=UPI0019D2C774|nr:DUF1003 domain-containing protein [Kocuria palustris]MBN6752035.1 DUF1003 domain-containing protein [Kocuria palustris]MBN6756990.1 DUF1003 domain-containing protein [Kocuria palustris]MBN6762018.1 DUF1003 domain-containing protein [Kocuria palustris]MBN6781500.1 DUF1003 domain-containing protein [Kocuria palustris]MBN6797984.1 DUF1003 domain-containing protein [Kocuria palustris]
MSESRTERRTAGLDTPTGLRHGMWNRLRPNPDAFGQLTEGFARFMGTPQFLLWMSVFVFIWLGWNTFMPEDMQFDPRALNYTLLTLMLSLQASYAAPLLLLAQNRQDDRDKVVAERDRQRTQENLADTEYLTREIAALRMSMREVATRDYVRSELRDLFEELLEELNEPEGADDADPEPSSRKRKGRKKQRSGETVAARSAGLEQPSAEQHSAQQTSAVASAAEDPERPRSRGDHD